MTATRKDPRYVDSDDPRAVLVAWGGASPQDATMDMGGWTDEDEDAFRLAVQDEAKQHGPELAYIEIQKVRKEE